MKLKRWLILSHLTVMLTPVISGLLLYIIIGNYNKNTQVSDYISAVNKFKTYQQQLDNSDIYTGYSLKDKKFISSKDSNSIKIELYNAVGQEIYSSDDNIAGFISKEIAFSDLYKIQIGARAYTLKMPVFNKDSVLVGFYKIAVAREDFIQGINYGTVITVLFFIIIVLCILISVWLLLNKKLNRPIKLLVEGMNKFALGDKNIVDYKYSDEIGELIKHFNDMKKDIEEKREIIEQQQKSKEYMISAISHDLKTPLTAIRAYAEAMINDENLDIKDNKNKSSVILNKSDYMKNMIDDLMMYNLLTTEYKMNFVELEGSEFFEMLFSGYDESCTQKKIKLTIDINVQGKYKVDVRQMTRVVDNLMANALRYTPVEGYICIGAVSLDNEMPDWLKIGTESKTVTWKKDGLLIVVKNQGNGIIDKEKEKVFMPFYQSDDSRNKKLWNGVGLGLSIVKLVIEKHYGEVKVFSEGNSTMFACWIPINKQ
ncbi:HAMP domain-containing sensor histidine kinase [Clostridium scatologenes]|uniref:histidine kinase n=1 Tax=Clostridium scatologenes TaxID=1548 RepID=A0A0E3JZL0_CLOSL|nr:HAMP domain-containing sensor histidine kinase [Clostridium scatologenes]AKA68408.1 ATPase, histidine kinase-, DNA gyrase B-, and HSP90-like domain protein [Clostridium scatologenes]